MCGGYSLVNRRTRRSLDISASHQSYAGSCAAHLRTRTRLIRVLGRQKSNSCAMRWATVTGALCPAGCGIDFADTLCCCQDIHTATMVDVSGVRAILLTPVDKKALLRGIRM